MIVRITRKDFNYAVKELRKYATFNSANKTWTTSENFSGSVELLLNGGYIEEVQSGSLVSSSQPGRGDRENSVSYVNGQRIEGVW